MSLFISHGLKSAFTPACLKWLKRRYSIFVIYGLDEDEQKLKRIKTLQETIFNLKII